jgi:hypothetical protein
MAKTGMMVSEEAAVFRQQHSEHISMATDSDATTTDAVFSMRSFPRQYSEVKQQLLPRND